MENIFQSKSVPRGTRTIWRYLSALILLFSLSIGQMWGADPTHAAPATKSYGGKTFLDATGTPGNAGTDNVYLNYGVNGINGYKASWSWFSCSTWNKSNNSYSLPTGSVGFCTPGSSSSSEFYGNINFTSSKTTSLDLYVTGTTEIGFIYQNNSDGSNKWINITLKEVTSTGEDASGDPVFSVGNNGKTLQYVKTGALDAAKYYHLNMATSGGSTSKFYSITFKRVVTSYTITYDANGGDGTMENSTNTVSACTFTAPTGKEFKEWNTLATGLGDSYDPGDAASSDLDLFAIWQTKVEKFTVKYMDGTTELGSETVNVGSTPAGLASDPTKDCYTFAGWDPALSGVSGSDGDEIEVNATWTPRYASSFDFGAASDLTKDNIVSKLNAVNIACAVGTGGSYDDGGTTGYLGYKFKNNNDKVAFLLKQGCQATVTYGYTQSGWTVNGTDAGVATATKAYVDKVYTATSGDVLYTLVNQSADSKTSVLTKIVIAQLYNATYTDETGDASGSENNVAEVTLPTPTETTVGTSTFTGWTANKVVYDGETAKAVGAALEAGKTYKLTDNTVFTAQWALISDFDVMFFQGFGEVDVQIGETQTISTGNYATAPAEDPERAGYRFLGWSYDATAEHIVNVSEYAITAATNFTAMWIQQFAVTFDGAGEVLVDNGATVASPNSPVTAGKVFQGWYNGESMYDFSAAVTENLALESKWMDADPNHFFYFYKDAFHYDGVVYKTPEGKVDEGAGESNVAITTPYTLFSGEGGITSIVANNAIYDSKSNWVNAYLKLNTEATSNLVFTIKSGFSAVLYMKMGGYSADPTVTLVDAGNNPVAMTGTISGRASDENGFAQVSFNLVAGTYTLTTTVKTLYISDIELITTVIPAHTVTYKAGEGTGDDVVDADATQVADVPGSFTAPEGKIFHGWKDALNNDVAVGTIVEADMELTAQWIAHYAVTFNMQGHGAAIVAQDIVEGSKAVKPADPSEIGYDFGGWFTDAECTAGNEFDFNTVIAAATELFAKWTAFDGCALLYPATSGSALNVGDNVDMQLGSKGASVAVVGMKEAGSIAYNERGLLMGGGSADIISVTLNNDMDIDTKITVTLDAKGGGRPRGLYLLTGTGANVKSGTLLGWPNDGSGDVAEGTIESFSYTVEASDGLEGTNVFRLKRQNSTYIKCIKVEGCGAAITYHNLTSAVNIAGKGTVTLGAGSVRVGHTTTAEFSDIDPLYEFVNWTVSGEGASIEDASANPATITMGTEDAVVTLNLQLIPVKFTVNYYDGETPMGSELVALNEHPTASEIDTDKRHFTFQGWAETDGGSVVDLNTITRTEATTVNLYAVYAPVVCPVSGYLFSMEFDETKTPESTVKAPRNGGVVELADYAIISGGEARIINNETGSDKDAITTSGQFKLTANGEFMKIELGCALQEGDIIRISDNNQKLYISTSTSATGTYQEFASSSVHEFSVSDAWNNIDDIYVLYHGSALTFTKVYVYRPALFTVSFNLKGHGSAAVADLTDVLEGSKITAPTAPTDEDYAFAGWYKETELENEWDFDNDVVNDDITLYAKWIDNTDATLKSLKYGSDEITLEDGVYVYEIALAAAVSSVPELTAVTSNPSANAAITDAASFDEEGKATSTVTVTPEKEGAATLTYTVNFTKLAELPQVGVSASTLWNFSLAGSTSLTNLSDVVLANLPGINNDENFNAQALEGSFNKLQGDGHSYQGSKLMFTVAEEGLLTIEFSGTNSKARHLQVCTGDGEIVIADWDYNSSSTHQTKSIEIPAGKITLKAFEGTTPNNARIYKMEYLSLAHSRTSGYNAGDLGTVCLEDATVIDGANLYKLAGLEEHGYLAFDEVTSGKLEAGKPYLFEVTNPSQISFYKQVGAAHSDTEIATNGMIGTFSGTTLYQNVAENYYYFSGRHIWRVNDFTVAIPVPAYRCYVDMDVLLNTPAPAPAPGVRRVMMGVNSKNTPTALDEIRQEQSANSQKLLINGQLFILRGKKMYDATGRLVK